MSETNPAPWSADHFARRLPFLRKRAELTQSLRRWFEARGFAEVETPILQISPGLEPHLHAFATRLAGPRPDEEALLYLHTSPEFAMKKLLAAGLSKIWQLARVMRNGERSSRHHPEFCMLEWYRAQTDYTGLMEDCENLICALAQTAQIRHIACQSAPCDLAAPWIRLTVADAFTRYAGIDLMATIDPGRPLEPNRDALAAQAKNSGLRVAQDDSWDDIFFRILGLRIEPELGKTCPTFLIDYPVTQAALARPKPGEPRLAERFELYIAGVEIANAFGELTDPVLQRQRFESDMDLKQALYGERYPIDEDFIAALSQMPPAAGIALGWDRLVMLLTGAEEIEDVLWLPVASPR